MNNFHWRAIPLSANFFYSWKEVLLKFWKKNNFVAGFSQQITQTTLGWDEKD